MEVAPKTTANRQIAKRSSKYAVVPHRKFAGTLGEMPVLKGNLL